MARVCHITNKIFQDKDSLINLVNSTVLIAQYTIVEFYNAEISIPMVIDLKDLNFHD